MVLLLKNKLTHPRIFFFLLIMHLSALSQPTISGPTCVVPGVVYQYTIKGSWKASSTMQVCISGGNFKSKDTSTEKLYTASRCSIEFITDCLERPGTGSLTLSSAIGNSTLNVTSFIIARWYHRQFFKEAGNRI